MIVIMSLVVVALFFVLFIVILFALLDYMDFLKIPVVKADVLQANSYIAFTFQGALADAGVCTEYSINMIKSITGRIFLFPQIYCLYHNSTDENQLSANVRYTLLFPVDTVEGLRERINASPDKNKLLVIKVPSLRVASSSFTYRNFLSYSLGQIRIYPFITKYARENGIIDTSTVLECYGVGEPIKYHLVLEHQEYFAGLREMEPIIVDSEFRKNHV
ncbi:hypothetical protein WA171_005272 [Blastocystis sp. BT1]